MAPPPPAPPALRGRGRLGTRLIGDQAQGGQGDEMENVRIRSACKEDVPGILWLIQVIQIHQCSLLLFQCKIVASAASCRV